MASRSPEDESVAQALPRSALRLMFTPQVGTLFWGKVSTSLGMWSYTMTAAVAIYGATGSAFAVAAASAMQFVPQFLLSLVSGTWADARDPKLLMVLGSVFLAVCSAVPAVASAAGSEGWAFAWTVIVCSGGVGVGAILGAPAMQSVLPRVVSAEELPAAVSMNFAPMTVSRIFGPLLGAAMVSSWGAGIAFTVAALAQAAAITCFAILRLPGLDDAGAGRDFSARYALRHVRANPKVMSMLLVAGATGFGSEPSLTLAPALADSLGGATDLAGGLSAAFGVGAACGLLIARLLSKRPGGGSHGPLIALSALSLGLLLSAGAVTPIVGLAGFSLMGIGFATALSTMTTELLLGVPALMRGRVMALWMMSFTGARPLASLVCGGVTDLASVRVALVVTALSTLATILATSLVGRSRKGHPAARSVERVALRRDEG